MVKREWLPSTANNRPRRRAWRYRDVAPTQSIDRRALSQPDPELAERSTLPPDASRRLWRYLVEGGPANADNFLRYAAALIAPTPTLPRKRGRS